MRAIVVRGLAVGLGALSAAAAVAVPLVNGPSPEASVGPPRVLPTTVQQVVVAHRGPARPTPGPRPLRTASRDGHDTPRVADAARTPAPAVGTSASVPRTVVRTRPSAPPVAAEPAPDASRVLAQQTPARPEQQLDRKVKGKDKSGKFKVKRGAAAGPHTEAVPTPEVEAEPEQQPKDDRGDARGTHKEKHKKN